MTWMTTRRLGYVAVTAVFVAFWLAVFWPTIALQLAGG
jgi:hypothetical protein